MPIRWPPGENAIGLEKLTNEEIKRRMWTEKTDSRTLKEAI